MKIRYRKKDGEIIAIGSMPDLKPQAGEEVLEINGEIPLKRLDFFKFDGEKVVEKTDEEKSAVLKKETDQIDLWKVKLRAARIDKDTLLAIRHININDLD